MNEVTLWEGGTREGWAPVARKVVTLPESGFRLGTWVAPAVFGAPGSGTIPLLDASSIEVLVSVGLSRHGVPVARVRLGSQDVHLLGADRVPEQTWTRLELVVGAEDEPGTALQVGLWVDDVEVDRAWLTEGLPADCCERTVDVVIGGQGDGWFGWFVGVLGTVWLAPPTWRELSRPQVDDDASYWIGCEVLPQVRDSESDLEMVSTERISRLRAETVRVKEVAGGELTWDAGASWELEVTFLLPVGSRASLALRGGAARIILERSAEQTLTCTVYTPGTTEPVQRSWNCAVTRDEIPLGALVDRGVVEAVVAGRTITTHAWPVGRADETARLRCARSEVRALRVTRLHPEAFGQDCRAR